MDIREDDDFVLELLALAEDEGEDLEHATYQAGEVLEWDRDQVGESIRRLIDRGQVEANVLGSWQGSTVRVLVKRITAAGRDRAEQLRRQVEIEE